MYRHPNDAKQRRVHVLFAQSALGDMVSAIPALLYLKKTWPHISLNIWSPSYAVDLWELVFPHENVFDAKDLSKADQSLAVITLAGGKDHTSLKTHLTDYAFHTILDCQAPSDMDRSYPLLESAGCLPIEGNYIVITPNYTAKNRQMSPDALNAVVDWAEGRGFKTVTLGQSVSVNSYTKPIVGTTSRFELGRTINMLNQTTLTEALEIMAGAQVVVGVDNGLIHLAACSTVPIVAGYTSVDPATRLPYRDGKKGHNVYSVIPKASLKCRFCQTKMHFDYAHDFRTCFYDDYECVSQLDGKAFVKGLAYSIPTE